MTPLHQRPRVIFTGGRDYTDRSVVRFVMAILKPFDPIIVHGAARGLDTLASEEAAKLGLNQDAWPADWERHGKAAGPIRNAAMLQAGAVMVLAFPGGKGTAHMVGLAERNGVRVVAV